MEPPEIEDDGVTLDRNDLIETALKGLTTVLLVAIICFTVFKTVTTSIDLLTKSRIVRFIEDNVVR